MSEFASVPVVTKCNTCKAAFASVDLVRDHYRSDWHVLNSKRRANGLKHVSLDEFRRQVPPKRKQPRPIAKTAAAPAPPQPSNSLPPKKEGVKKIEKTADPELIQRFTEMAHEMGVESDRVESVVNLAVANESKGNESDDEVEEMEEDAEPIVVEPNVSIFDNAEFETVEECLAHMEENFGFFIPEREFLVDLPGLLVYLGEKVKIGGLCLYCQKQFQPGRPLQNHMQSKSHCKIAYQEGVDVDEFEDFYDFSSSYGDKGGGTNEDGEEDEELEDEEGLEIAPTGELLLTDGRRVGHRAFRRYYKQRYTPADNRDSVTAQRREDLMRISGMGGGVTRYLSITGKGSEVSSMSDNEVMSLMVRHHKEIRKMQIIEQRATRRQEYRHIRREYQSVKDKLRSSVNTTAKIRDYHSRLM